MERSDHHAGDFRGHRRAAGGNIGNSLEDLIGAGALENISAGTGFERLKDEISVGVNGYHNYLKIGHFFGQPRRAGNAGFVGQVNIHQRYIGLVLGHFNERLLGSGAGADAAEIWRVVNQFHERFSHRVVVFDDGDFGHVMFLRFRLELQLNSHREALESRI